MPQIFKISRIYAIFDFFSVFLTKHIIPLFFTGDAWNASALPVSKSIRFNKQMLIFNAIFEKISAEYVPRIKIAVLKFALNIWHLYFRLINGAASTTIYFLKGPELVMKYQFLVQNRKKILKFGFFDNFSHIGGNIPWIFSVLRASTTILKLQNFFTPRFSVRKLR